MKKHSLFHIILSLGILCGACIAMPKAAFAQDITTGLVGHWRLDETSGTTAADSSGNGNDGTINGTDFDTDSVRGQIDNGLYFDGGNSIITVPHSSSLNVNDTVSVSFWMKSPEDQVNNFGRILQKGDGGVNDGFIISKRGSLSDLHVVLGTSAGFNQFFGLGLVQPFDDTWRHIVVVLDNGSRIVYMDGVEVVNNTYSHGTGFGNTDDVLIGAHNTGGSNALTGTLDDVRLYNRVLTAEDVEFLYYARPGNLRFNSNNDTIQYFDDDSWVAAGPPKRKPNAVNFDGTNDYLNGTNVLGPDSSSGTLSVWFKLDNNSGGDLSIFRNGSGEFSLAFDDGGDEMRIYGNNPSASNILDIRTTNYNGAAGWHHLLASWDLSTGSPVTHLYLNDVDDQTQTAAIGNETINYQNGSINVGSNTSGVLRWDGDIADLWVKTGTYIDLSVEENRRAFIDAAGNPVDLGADGSKPTGTAPDVFLSGDTADWHTNKGTGGGFTENGTLTTAPSPREENYTWQQLGNSFNPAGSNGNPALTGLNKTTVAFVDNSTDDLITIQFDGTNWAQIGNALDLTPDIADPALATLDGNTIALADPQSDELRTYSWDGTDWSQIGNSFNLTAYSQSASITALSSSTIAYVNRDDDLITYSFDGTDWSQVGNALTISGINSNSGLATIDTNIIAFFDASNEDLRAYSWDGTNWSQIGNDLNISGAGSPYITQLGQNKIAFMDDALDTLQTFEWNGTDWQKTGTDLSLSGAGYGRLATLDNNTVALYDPNGPDLLYTYSFAYCSTPSKPIGTIIYESTNNQMQYCDGENWIPMGPPGDGGAGCSSPTGAAGDLTYNTTHNVMQYCEGDEYIAIGKAADPCDDPAVTAGTTCTDGTIYAGLSPDGSVPMYTTAADAGTFAWGSFGILRSTNGTITGEADTTLLAAFGAAAHPAAHHCDNLTDYGQTDWYLPSTGELQVLYTNRTAIGSLGSYNYWSTKENGTDFGRRVHLGTGVESSRTKSDGTVAVRCVRRGN